MPPRKTPTRSKRGAAEATSSTPAKKARSTPRKSTGKKSTGKKASSTARKTPARRATPKSSAKKATPKRSAKKATPKRSAKKATPKRSAKKNTPTARTSRARSRTPRRTPPKETSDTDDEDVEEIEMTDDDSKNTFSFTVDEHGRRSFEIVNGTSKAQSLLGWAIQSEKTKEEYLVTRKFHLPPGGKFVLVVGKPGVAKEVVDDQTVWISNEEDMWSKDGDEAHLINPKGNAIAKIQVDPEEKGYWCSIM